jgi:hypothetical protein
MRKVTHHKWEECSYESLPQWVKHKLAKVADKKVILRGRSFFYVCQQIWHYPTSKDIEYYTIYHRKLRYHSRKPCKYFENWKFSAGADCNYDAGYYECFDYDKLTEDTFREQRWLNGLAFSLTVEEGERRFCGDWCPGYEP